MSFDPTEALKHRCVLLSGAEDVLRMRALAEIVRRSTAGEDFDLQTFVAGDADVMEWLGSAATAPFLGERRTVVVRNVLREDEPQEAFGEKGERLASLPETAALVLVVDDEPGDDQRQQRLLAIRKSLEAVVKKGGGLVLTFASDPAKARATVKAEAARLGTSITDRAADTLLEMVGGNLSRSFEELEKLAVYAGIEPQITEADVRAVAVPSREWQVFKLVDALVAGRVSEATRQMRILIGSAKAEEAAFSRVLPMLDRQLRLVWQARSCIEAKCSPPDVSEAVASEFPEKNNLLGEKDFVQRNAMREARKLTHAQLARCFRAVADADEALKGLKASFSGIDTLERMVLEMAEAVRP